MRVYFEDGTIGVIIIVFGGPWIVSLSRNPRFGHLA